MMSEVKLFPIKPCPECKKDVRFIEDIPTVWCGYCRFCQISLIIHESLDKDPEIYAFLKKEVILR